MPDRTRPIRKEICLNEQELSLIQHKMRQLGTHNFGAYARKMLIDGYIIKVDYTEQTVDKLTLRRVPKPDFRTTVSATFNEAEFHPLINKK